MEQNKLTGVWIDNKKAVISSLQGDDSSLDVLTSGIEGNERIDGEGRPEGRFGGQFVDDEQADEARRNVIARGVRVNDLDVLCADEARDPLGAENAERIADRGVKDVFRGQKRESFLPFVGRAERHENFVSALVQTARQVRQMTLSAAEGSDR